MYNENNVYIVYCTVVDIHFDLHFQCLDYLHTL